MAVKLLLGFESGGLTQLSTASSGTAIVTTPIPTGGGAYALSSTATAGSTPKALTAFSGAAGIYFHCSFAVNNVTTSETGDLALARVTGGSTNYVFLLRRTAGTPPTFALTILSGTTTVWCTANVTIAANTYYDCDFFLNTATTGQGTGNIRFQGTQVASFSAGAIASVGAVTAPLLAYRFQGTNTATLYIDDIVCDDAAHNSSAQIVARQFYNGGTPTYDAFNLVGGGTKYGNISETPFSATLAISSPTTAAIFVQTAYINSFSNTETGKGTGTIDSNDTIAAARVSAIAKTSSAASGGSSAAIRRRLAGADTDATVALTTADLFYVTDPFTTNLTDLNAGQAGWVRNSSSATQQIEDMWVEVAYISVANPPPFLFPRRRTYLRR